MTGLLIGALAGLGLVLILMAMTGSRQVVTAPIRRVRMIDLAGVSGVRLPALLGACVIVGGLVALVVLAVTSLPVAGMLAGVAGAWLPVAMLRRRSSHASP